ncbi:MAG: hypothetical protein EZS28_000034 [Streblomastix strix]|uniref:DDE-1 domain-containing protein n=1 Tax=Streblomastix strix TaxID=222440 RepID=A0A5J4XB03_9EUKA|nr:MAG: hypothetical protein EZS28_000034 [Streblomastix strix]
MGHKRVSKRSQLSRSSIRGQSTLQAAVIALLLIFPGQITLPARDFNITAQQCYKMVRSYYRQTVYLNEYHRNASYLALERQHNLAASLFSRIEQYEPITLINFRDLLIQQHRQEREAAVKRALQLGFSTIADEFRVNLPDPSLQYVRNFAQRFRITFTIQSGKFVGRKQASYASNILNWLNNVHSKELVEGVLPRAIYNMDEANCNFNIRERTAKRVGSKRSTTQIVENVPNHISLVQTISAGARSPPSYFIIGELQKVPQSLVDLHAAEEVLFSTSTTSFMIQDTFRQWVRVFCTWIHKQKQMKYLNQNETILFLLVEYKSRNDETAKQLLEEEGITTDILPGSLTHILQPLDSVVFRQFRTALNDQLGGIFHDDLSLSEMIVDYLVEHEDRYQDYFDDTESLQQYATKMRVNGEYGEGSLFGAITDMFDVQLEILMPYETVFVEGQHHPRTLRLAYIGHIHYMTVRLGFKYEFNVIVLINAYIL